MSEQAPLFNIPRSKKNMGPPMPSLNIKPSVSPSPPPPSGPMTTNNEPGLNKSQESVGEKKKPKRKPPPIDFLRINGSHSFNDNDDNSNSNNNSKNNNDDNMMIDNEGTNENNDRNDNNNVSNNSNNIYANTQTNEAANTTTNHIINLNPSYVNNNSDFQMPPGFQNKSLSDITGEEWQLLVNSNQIVEVDKLGEGNGGSVAKCKINNDDKIFALKLINTDSNIDIQKQILRELQYNKLCDSDNIVKYYGTFIIENQSMIGITMEYMGGKSLDSIYKRVIEIDPSNRINEKVLGKVAESILLGLNYLHQQKIIHRDIKPSNILLNNQGQIKLCDFGVSGEVVNSLATTFVGTQYYMAPERIMGKPYTVNCDIWSLGLTLLEVASGKYPFSDKLANNMGPIELLSLILEYEPKLMDLPQENIFWSDLFKNFIHYCVKKNTSERPSPRQMLQHPWCLAQSKIRVRMDKFVQQLWDSE